MACTNPGEIFFRKDVIQILKRMTGFNLEKIFKTGFNVKLRDSEIKLLTSAQLEKVNNTNNYFQIRVEV